MNYFQEASAWWTKWNEKIIFWMWVAAAAAIAWLAIIPTDTYAQLITASLIMTALMVARRFNIAGAMREVFLFLAAYLSLRYFFWRTFNTLVYFDPISFVLALMLYGAEIYGIVIYLLGLFVNIYPLDRVSPKLPDNPDEWPGVDIFIPTYNEDPSIIELTLFAVVQLDYPKHRYTVNLCDDGGTDQKCNDAVPAKAAAARARRKELSEMCDRIGAKYCTRAKNLHAKAGNVNSAFNATSNDLVLILDVDHVPTRDILRRTVGLFLEDPKLFLVQTPHFFLNPDPIEKNLDTFKVMPNESEMFYSVIQRGLDFWNAAFFCGSAAVLRRKYLAEVGGISGDTITEDAETALLLHSRGYTSAFIRQPMVAGLSPETLGGFMVQRSRWAMGMVQIFLLKNPMLLKGLNLGQRLCYLNCCFFWFFAYGRLVYMVAPLGFLILGLKVYNASVMEFFAYAIPHMLAAMFISDFLYGRVRWSFISELYELIQAPYTMPSIIQVLMNPRAPTFIVTPKGEQLDKDFISPLGTPFYTLLFGTIIGLCFGLYKYIHYPMDRSVIVITMAWCTLNLVMIFAAIGVMFERRQRRAWPRIPENLKGTLEVNDQIEKVTVDEVAMGGLRVLISLPLYRKLKPGQALILNVESSQTDPLMLTFHMKILKKRIVYGVPHLIIQFDYQNDAERKSAVVLIYGDSDRWLRFQEVRMTKLGITGSLGFIILQGVKHSYAHWSYATVLFFKWILESIKNYTMSWLRWFGRLALG
ncbi:MAG: UDP-forming cellulose synthase catalytic subunit [Candidatus Methylacidiphilales bacterium]|nr:UDP-forming cellulose synthase catalytic subunit [Candidatus Methylacidiphilales bacterium]